MKLYTWTTIFLFSLLMQMNKQKELAACGQLQNILIPHITNGHDTHRWPWHAAIYHQFNETDSSYQCGGTLVSSKFVLTAAHCVLIAADQVTVSLGRLHLNASQSIAPFVKVAEILTHPGYSPENYENDIAMITLSTDVIFNSYVQPICMWKSDKVDLSEVIGRFGTVVGWGVTETGETSNVLQEVSLPVVESLKCLRSNRDLFGRFLSDANFCAGTRNGTSVCTGDSGGSMTFQENGRFYLRGIVSVGASKLIDQSTNKFMCDSMQYAIFTDVAQYLPWIKGKIGCKKVVRCYSDGDECTITLNVENSKHNCKIFFDEISIVKYLEMSGAGSTIIHDLSSPADKLEILTLENFKLKIVERARLSPFSNILELNLGSNGITQLYANNFGDLTNLKKLNIYEPALDVLHAGTFGGLNNLEVLSIKFNNLTNLPAGMLRNNINMRTLDLSSNRLSELHPDFFETLRNIDELRLNNNELETLPVKIFRNNEKMRQLHLQNNLLKEVHEDLFTGLTNLEEVNLGANGIVHVPPGLFRSNAKLKKIYLAYNKIETIGVDFNAIPQLQYINLEKNRCINSHFFLLNDRKEYNDLIIKCTRKKIMWLWDP